MFFKNYVKRQILVFYIWSDLSVYCSCKVRKPYTVTKQREKWSEEEHDRFLEAIKLYGRGWRQIQGIYSWIEALFWFDTITQLMS